MAFFPFCYTQTLRMIASMALERSFSLLLFKWLYFKHVPLASQIPYKVHTLYTLFIFILISMQKTLELLRFLFYERHVLPDTVEFIMDETKRMKKKSFK